MSISDQHNRCHFYPNDSDGINGVPSALNYSWTQHQATDEVGSGDIGQRQSENLCSASSTPNMTYYENQMSLQRRFVSTGKIF